MLCGVKELCPNQRLFICYATLPTLLGGTTDARGAVQLTPAPAVGTRLQVEALGYKPRTVAAPAPDSAPTTLLLAPSAAEIDEVVVTATRTNSRIENQPERVEVLGEEEMQEENGIKPGNIASLLGDIAGTQIQPTSPTMGNADLRTQGLQGQYSQILRDGLPLYGGFAGSFGICRCRRSTCGRLSCSRAGAAASKRPCATTRKRSAARPISSITPASATPSTPCTPTIAWAPATSR